MSHFVLYLGLSASLVQRCEQMCKHMFSHIAINIDQDQALLYGLIYKIRKIGQLYLYGYTSFWIDDIANSICQYRF